MLKTVLAAALAVAVVVASAPTVLTTSEMKIAEAAANPTTEQQQQKMKDCNEKWKEERANTGAKGGTAYRKFLSACLKKPPA